MGGLSSFRELPNILKPTLLILVIVQMVCLFSPHLVGFSWFVILTTILMLIITFLVVVVFAIDYTPVTEAPYWPLAEMIYAAVFSVCSGVNFFYFIVTLFKHHFNFWYLLGSGISILLLLGWALDALIFFRNRNSFGGTSSSTNQATATPAYPSFPAGHTTGSNPA